MGNTLQPVSFPCTMRCKLWSYDYQVDIYSFETLDLSHKAVYCIHGLDPFGKPFTRQEWETPRVHVKEEDAWREFAAFLDLTPQTTYSWMTGLSLAFRGIVTCFCCALLVKLWFQKPVINVEIPIRVCDNAPPYDSYMCKLE